MKVHWKRPRTTWTACGRPHVRGPKPEMTTNVNRVTCDACRKTSYFKNKIAEQKDYVNGGAGI